MKPAAARRLAAKRGGGGPTTNGEPTTNGQPATNGGPTGGGIFESIVTNPGIVANAMASRQDLMRKLFDPRRDIDEECGYPKTITDYQYRRMYDREMGKRVVNVWPEETWRVFPRVYEDADPDNMTPFEEDFAALDKRHQLLARLQRIDELSGVGQYGIILWGLDDGLTLDQPVAGSERWAEATGGEPGEAPQAANKRRIIYIRTLDASLVRVAAYDADQTSPRFGQPTYYTITLTDPRNNEDGAVVQQPGTLETKVHWSRVTHVADNRTTSEVLGQPRQEAVWNRLYDLRKCLGGSGEMLWRGGFPGVSLETQPGLENAEIDTEATRQMMFDYMNGLQRYLALTGMSAKSLQPQVADPGPTFDIQVKALCIIIGVPYRVFMGTEEGRLAGQQDSEAWSNRLVNRQQRYVTPMLINPVLQRLVDYGALRPTATPQGWVVDWPDAHNPSDKDVAEIAGKKTEAMAKYVAGGVDTLVPPYEFLTLVCGLEKDVAEAILEAAVEHIEGLDGEEPVPGHGPTPPGPGPGQGGFDEDEDENEDVNEDEEPVGEDE